MTSRRRILNYFNIAHRPDNLDSIGLHPGLTISVASELSPISVLFQPIDDYVSLFDGDNTMIDTEEIGQFAIIGDIH